MSTGYVYVIVSKWKNRTIAFKLIHDSDTKPRWNMMCDRGILVSVTSHWILSGWTDACARIVAKTE